MDRKLASATDLPVVEDQLQLAAAAIDAVSDLILWSDPSGRFIFANRAACETLGYERNELLRLTIPDITPGMGAEDWPEQWLAVKTEGSLHRETHMRCRDGRIIQVELAARYVTHQGREYTSASIRDVSERTLRERELRERKQRLRAIVDTSQAGIVLVDGDGVITFANRCMAELLGITIEELVGSRYLSHLDSSQTNSADTMMQQLARGEVDQVYAERDYRRRDGSHFWGYLSARRHEDAAGNLVSLVGVIVDITPSKEAAEALRRSEERFRSLIELAADAVVHGDQQGNIVSANASAVALSGYPLDELIGMNIQQLFTPEEFARAPLRYDLLQQGVILRTERTLTRKDGSLVPIDMNSKMMPDGTYQTFVRDVSERKKGEDVLRASEEKFATAFRRAPTLMAISSLHDGRIHEVNDRFCEATGYSREELLGHTAISLGLLTPEDRDAIRRELTHTRRLPDRELPTTSKDGRKLQMLWGGEVITVDGKKRLLTIAQDISVTVRLQEELAKTQKLESLGLLAGGLAHDFNNVLTGVLGNLSFARMLVGDSHNAAQCLMECEKAATRASELTRQLLTFSRGGAPMRKVVDTRRLLDEAVSFSLRGSNVRAVLDVAQDLAYLNADDGQISQVLANLLINAKQAMPTGGTVAIRAANVQVREGAVAGLASGLYVRIEVEDTGVGIPTAALSKVFDPYFTTKPGGTGLGLSSVYSIVRRHAGSVNVTSQPDVGTTFTLHLPTASPDARLPVGSAAVQVPKAHRGLGRVLLMDDEVLIRDLASRVLHVLGYEAVACADGAEAVRQYRAASEQGKPFSAVLLDLTIPGGMGGREAAEQIRAFDPRALLVVSTGYSNDPVVADCQAFGFAGAVAKPYSVETLAAELTRLLAGPPAP